MTFKDLAAQLSTAIQTVPNLIQVLREGFQEVEAGSDIEVTQIVTTGTEIANIKIGDDPAVAIYAPSAEVDYSTTERLIGKWIDDKELYEVTVEITPESTINTMVSYPHSIANIEKVVSFNAYLIGSSGSCQLVPSVQLTDGTGALNAQLSSGALVTPTNVQLIFGYDRSNTKVYVTFRYTKTSE